MSLRDSRKYKAFLWLLTLACLGGAGFIAYKMFFAAGSSAKQLRAAEDAYAQGLAAYGQKNWADALTRFDESKLLAQKTLDMLTAEMKAGKVPEDEAKRTVGMVNWLKARAIRDHAYAKAQADGKAIPEAPDPQYNETFRAIPLIPDAEARVEAIVAVRTAAGVLSADPQTSKDLLKEILKESLRVELVLAPIQWKFAEPFLRKSLELSPDDARTHYYLARFEFDQPFDESGVPTPATKKSTDRVDRAREHLVGARKSPAQFWRSVGLEAEILDWAVDTAAARKLKPDAVAAAEKALDEFLFGADGAVPAAAKGERLAGIGRSDALGLARVFLSGAERGHADARRPGGNADRLRLVARGSLDLADKIAAEPATKPFLPDILQAAVQVAVAAQPILSKADATGWRDHTARLDAALAKNPEVIKSRPAIHKQLAQLAVLDSLQAAKGRDAATAKALTAKAIAETEAGLKAAEAAKHPAAEIDELHALLAERKLLAGEKVETVEPHLARLRDSTTPGAKQVGQFLEAAVAERQGKMDKARKLLQPLAADRTNADRAFQANVLLFRACRAVGDEVGALAALSEVDTKYSTEQISPPARAWADEYVGGADAITADRILANLGVALQAVVQFVKDNPGKPVPGELVSGSETAAETLMKKLRPPTPGDRKARLAFAAFYRATNRRNLAETRLAELAADYPDSVDVLRARCALLVAPADDAPTKPNPNGIPASDALIRKFLKDYPGERAGRLFYAEWLVSTNRAALAVEFLKDPANFPGGRDEVVERVLAAALLRSGQRDEAERLLHRLPPDPAIDAVLIQAATTREAGAKQLKEALGRYDDPGLFRVYEAAMQLGEGKYEEAIRGFASAVEFTRVGKAAKAGLQRALVAYAQVEPAKARDAAVRMAAEMPDDPGPYLAAADAALILDDVGEASDKWEQVKTAWAALNKWEAVALKSGTPRGDIALARVQFQLLAGNTAGAMREAANGLARDPKHVPTMLILAELSLAPPADVERARKLYESAVAENPSDPRLPTLDARIKATAGDWAGAVAVYERLVGESPRTSGLYAMLVGSSEAAKKPEDALKWARQWQTTLPDDPQAVATLVRILAGSNKSDAVKLADDFVSRQVAAAKKRAADATPPPPAAEAEKAADRARGAALLVGASGFFRGRVYDEAEARAREAVKYVPDDERAALLLGDVAILRQNWDAALTVYGSLLKQNPRHFIAGNNLAWILAEKKNNPAAALEVVEEVRKGRNGVKPVSAERLPADFLDTIGVVYAKLDQPAKYPEMKALFEAAVRRYPDDPRMYLYLGLAQSGTGEKSKALENLDAATRLAGGKNSLPEDQNKSVIAAAEAARKRIRG